MAQENVRDQIVDVYNKRAKNYDLTANLYYLLGYPEWKYRRLAVEALRLQPGDTVVEIGCGTGLNFKLYQERIGPAGRIIGVDLTAAMLEQARQRIEDEGWENVELLHQDALTYNFPTEVDAVTSTFALSLIPEAPAIIRRAAGALAEGGRIAMADLQIPASWPDWLTAAALAIVRPFAVTDEWVERRPWPAIQATMRELLKNVALNTYYLNMTYIISGEARR
jgi:ubiquinone/menaquinone biosynthesis C-methylase UbiE